MKYLKISILLLIVSYASAKGVDNINDNKIKKNENHSVSVTTLPSDDDKIGKNGFDFTILDAGINTSYSEYGSGFFRNKFIMISSKKIGGFAKTDPATGEGYKNIFCLDVKSDGSLKKPLLFSRIINTLGSEDQITFTPDENTMYFTRATEEDSKVFEIYKTHLEEESAGNWINITKLKINTYGYSIENPTVTPNGKYLYFSSNKPGGFGGYDIYKSLILEDGTLSEPVNLGKTVNTNEDDKFPTFSKDGSYLYFASKGHENLGGFDMFRSRIDAENFSSPLNLGNTINTKYDEVAMYFASNTKGYISSSKSFGKGKYDIYKFDLNEVIQTIQGKVLDVETLQPLANATLVLKDANNNVIAELKTDKNAKYDFVVKPFEKYSISVVRDGFDDKEINFKSTKGDNRTYLKNLLLDPTKAEIVEEKEELVIKVENINFDFNKAVIRDEAKLTLNKVYNVLNDNPEMKINLKAHTDSKGKASYNLMLSERRAQSSRKYLISKGIDSSRIIAKGYGESELLYDCNSTCTKEQDEANRRIEFVIIK